MEVDLKEDGVGGKRKLSGEAADSGEAVKAAKLDEEALNNVVKVDNGKETEALNNVVKVDNGKETEPVNNDTVVKVDNGKETESVNNDTVVKVDNGKETELEPVNNAVKIDNGKETELEPVNNAVKVDNGKETEPVNNVVEKLDEEKETRPEPASVETNGTHKENETETDIIKAENKIFSTFEGFELKKVLSNSADQKRVVIEGVVGEHPAIVILDKKPFAAETLPELLSLESKLQHTFQNDIYGSYDCFPSAKGGEIKTTIVYPATQKHIDKYIYQAFYLVNETPQIYAEVTLPYLEKSAFTLQWVFNILEHKKEEDRIVFEDKDSEVGFILLPDLKWDGKQIENLYLTAIVHTKGLKSLRDLTSAHLPVLENIWNNGTKTIVEKYGVKQSQLRVFIHYQPSYYHLHVHFTSLQFNASGTEKSHLLQTVIDNIKFKSSFYQEATLPFAVKENDNLYNDLTKHGYNF